jgi:hypothetical protein
MDCVINEKTCFASVDKIVTMRQDENSPHCEEVSFNTEIYQGALMPTHARTTPSFPSVPIGWVGGSANLGEFWTPPGLGIISYVSPTQWLDSSRARHP